MTQTQNYDPIELEKFSQGDWWDTEQGPYALLHQLNPLRLAFVSNHTALANKKIIDIGCGGGIFSEALAQAGAQVTGLDLNAQALEQAVQHATQNNLTIDYQCQTVEIFAAQHADQFDVVTCMEMLEHVPCPESIIAAAAHLLKPNGIVAFSTINRNLRAYLEAIVVAEYCLKLLPRGTHTYQKFIKPSELCDAARGNHLSLLDLKGVRYELFGKHFVLSDTPQTNYLIAFKKG